MTYAFVVVLDLRCHADLRQERRKLFAVFSQDDGTVEDGQIRGSAHEEHVAATGGRPFLFAHFRPDDDGGNKTSCVGVGEISS